MEKTGLKTKEAGRIVVGNLKVVLGAFNTMKILNGLVDKNHEVLYSIKGYEYRQAKRHTERITLNQSSMPITAEQAMEEIRSYSKRDLGECEIRMTIKVSDTYFICEIQG